MMLPAIKSEVKTGKETFTYNGRQQRSAELIDFWKWSLSDLLTNATRGVLAEFIVAMALGMHECVRSEWDAFDLIFKDEIKIEVKSAAYIQSWFQRDYSRITFGIQPTRAWDAQTNLQSVDSKRQADVYVFCLLTHKDQETINPLNLNQWEFYVLSTHKLDEQLPHAKSMGFNRLLSLSPKVCSYKRLKRYILEASIECSLPYAG